MLLGLSDSLVCTESIASNAKSRQACDFNVGSRPACTKSSADTANDMCAELRDDEDALGCINPRADARNATHAELCEKSREPRLTESEADNNEPGHDRPNVSISIPKCAKNREAGKESRCKKSSINRKTSDRAKLLRDVERLAYTEFDAGTAIPR